MEALLNILPIIQIALAVILTGAILLQQRGAGLGGAFGGADGGVHYERRGFERTLFKTTIVIAVLFIVSVMISVIYAPKTEIEVVGDTATTTDEIPFTLTPKDFIIENKDETKKGENLEITPIDINENKEPE